MKANLIVVGSEDESFLIGKVFAHLMPNDVIVVSPQKATLLQLTKPVSEQFVLSNPYPLKMEGKQFKCKGKHQYRLSDTIKDERENGTISKEVWSCQCGKVLGS